MGKVNSSPADPQLKREWFLQFVMDRGRDLVKEYGARAIGVGIDTRSGQLAVRFYVTTNWDNPKNIPASFSFTPPGEAEVRLPTCVMTKDEHIQLQHTVG